MRATSEDRLRDTLGSNSVVEEEPDKNSDELVVELDVLDAELEGLKESNDDVKMSSLAVSNGHHRMYCGR